MKKEEIKELGQRMVELMGSYNMKVFDLEIKELSQRMVELTESYNIRVLDPEYSMKKDEINELGQRIVELMESYNMKVFDLEHINELIEKTIERAEKECSY